ncbi:ABC multidrug transporter B [Cladobotryum mycophilum]|uniref:ABC multidrug transporter B n=1 Tax=Cladobotryum mycophilum TaxID=491253 RepID=A0ABR0SI46_9HYPO
MSLCDRVFGPRIDVSCRAFDFTIYFEDIFLATLPNVIFLITLSRSLYGLINNGNVVERSKALVFKAVVYFSILICQTIFLVSRLKNTDLRTQASLATDVLALAAVIAAGCLSWLQHHYSERPSTLIVIFLTARLIFDIARIRTLWFIPTALEAAVTLSLFEGLVLCALFLESLGKRETLRKPERFAGSGPEPFTSFWSLVGFTWLLGTLKNGYRKVLSIDDLPPLDYRLNGRVLQDRLETTLAKYDMANKHTLLKACLRAYASPFLAAVIPRLCLTGFTFVQPFLINSLIAYISNKDSPTDHGKGIIGAYALVYLGMAVSTATYWYHTSRFLIRIRGGLIAIIYQQTVRARAVDLGEINGLTLMGTDVERIVAGFKSIHEIWASLFDICIAVYLLEKQMFVACLIPVAIVLVFVLVTFQLSAWSKATQKIWIEMVEQRLGITTSMLASMRAVKMLGLSQKIFDLITNFRHAEINGSKKFRKLLVLRIFFSNSPRIFAPLVTFLVFAAISHAKNDNSILAAKAFTSISLIALLTTPAQTLIQAIPSIMQCIGCFERIQEFCHQPISPQFADTVDHISDGQSSHSMMPLRTWVANSESAGPHSPIIKFCDQSFSWTKTGPATLKSLSTEIMAGRVTVILGPTGSGKSTLLESMLGETVALCGQTERRFATAAYCSQVPWLSNGTICENITSGTDFPVDDKWYKSVLWACGLEADIDVLSQGDQTLVGNSGSRLSGGQRQRVSLARAIYSRSPVLLLDDVFSGVDARNIVLISERLFGPQGLVRRNKSTVILVTHASSLVSLADDVIVLENGIVVESGSLSSLRETSSRLPSLKMEQPSLIQSPQTASAQDGTMSSLEERCEAAEEVLSALGEQASELKSQNGDFSVYQYYSRCAGHGMVAGFCAMTMMWAFCDEFSVVVIDWWSSANVRNLGGSTNGIYLGAYAVLCIASPISMCLGCWLLFVNIFSNTAKSLHHTLLSTVVKAPLRFFQETDLGSITNRFSQDLELIGMDLPITAANYISTACECFWKVILLAVFAKYLSATLPIIAIGVFLVQRFYLRTSRQVRLLDIEAKAPVYLLFLETTGGASTVRSFGWQYVFKKKLECLLDRSQRPVYILYCIQQWLTLVLDLIVAALAVILVAIIVTWRDSFSPGAVGVSLVTVMTFNSSLTRLITYWAALETSVGAVGRIKAFVASTSSEEDELGIQPQNIPSNWPKAGAIEYSDVSATYKPNTSPVLKNLSISIKPGEKIAICGRSGSGKTSFILTLLHMINFDGSVTIDGVEISQLPPSDLRSRINVVPQEPFLIPGSVRLNVDPLETASDGQVIAALQRLKLWDRVVSIGGIDSQTALSSWSVGEKQLLCLARAMVRKGKSSYWMKQRAGRLHCQDPFLSDQNVSWTNCSAKISVDTVTEAIMQDVIETEFSQQTVLAVIHRLHYIETFDRVAVLDKGKLVEYDSPHQLLATPSVLADIHKAGAYGSRTDK